MLAVFDGDPDTRTCSWYGTNLRILLVVIFMPNDVIVRNYKHPAPVLVVGRLISCLGMASGSITIWVRLDQAHSIEMSHYFYPSCSFYLNDTACSNKDLSELNYTMSCLFLAVRSRVGTSWAVQILRLVSRLLSRWSKQAGRTYVPNPW